MDITLEDLSKRLNTSTSNLRIYLCRGEFSSCCFKNGKVRDLDEEKIKRLELLLWQRKNRWER